MLLETIQSAEIRIAQLINIEKTSQERETIVTRCEELKGATKPLRDELERLGWMNAKIDRSRQEFKKAVEAISSFRESVTKNLPIQEVTKGQKWARMLNLLSALANILHTQVRASWRQWVSACGNFEDPDSVSRRLAETPNNMAALEAYRRCYSTYTQIARKVVPDSSVEIEQVKRVAAEVEQAFAVFDFSAPAAVKEFLRAANSIRGAPFDLLTDDVRTWLVEHNLASKYIVRSVQN